MADKAKQDFDFSLIVDDVESSDGQSRHVYGKAHQTAKKETAEETA